MIGGGSGRTACELSGLGASGTRAAFRISRSFRRTRGRLRARRGFAAAQPIDRGAGKIVGVAALFGRAAASTDGTEAGAATLGAGAAG